MASPIFASSPGIIVTAADFGLASPAGPVVLLSFSSTIADQIVIKDISGLASITTPITVSTVNGVSYTRDISDTIISSIQITRPGDSLAVVPITQSIYKVLDSRAYPNPRAPLAIKPSYELISTVSTYTLDVLSTLTLADTANLHPLISFEFINAATAYSEYTSTLTNTITTATFYSENVAGNYNYHSTASLSTLGLNAADFRTADSHDASGATVIGHVSATGTTTVAAHYSTVAGGLLAPASQFTAGSNVTVVGPYSTLSNFYSAGSIDVRDGFTIGGYISAAQLAVFQAATHTSTVYVSAGLTVGSNAVVGPGAAWTSSIASGKATAPVYAFDTAGVFIGSGAFIDAATYSTIRISTLGFTASNIQVDNGVGATFKPLYTSNTPSKLYYDGVEVGAGGITLNETINQMLVSSLVTTSTLYVSSIYVGGSNYSSPYQMEINGGMRIRDSGATRLYVAGGSNNTTTGIGTLKWSTDGLTWNNNATGGFGNSTAGGSGQGIGWNGRLWVAVGHSDLSQRSTIQTSTDGSNWTAVASGGFGPPTGSTTLTDGHGIAWNGQLWVAAGSYGNSTTPLNSLLYSADGSNWSDAASGGFQGTAANNSTGFDVAWNGRQWVAAGRSDISGSAPIDALTQSAQNALVGLYSLKKLRSAYSGPLISVRRSFDNSNNDFYGDLNGNLSNLSGTSITSWLSTSPPSTGFISKWWDQSTAGNHATQTTDISQATYNAAGYLTFGTLQYFSLPDGTVPGSNSKYTMVYKHNAIDGGTTGVNRVILASGNNVANQGIFLTMIGATPITNAFYRDDWRADSTQFTGYALGNTFTAVYNQATATSYLNGTLPGGTPTLAKSAQTNPSTSNFIGYAPAYGGGTNLSMVGDLYYLAIYNDALTTRDRNIAETNGPVYINNYTIQYSGDGSNWNPSELSAPGCSVFTRGLAWNGNYWVAVGRDTTAANNIKYSYDGRNWSNSVSGAFNTEGFSVCWNGQIWMATGRDTTATANTIKYSYDGRNWSNITSGGFSNTATTGGIHIAYDGTKWLAGGFGTTATSNMKYSYNGLNWSDAAGSFTTAGFAATYGADLTPTLKINNLDIYTAGINPFLTSTNTIFSQVTPFNRLPTHSTSMVLNNTLYINPPGGVSINIERAISSANVALYVYGSTFTNNPNPIKLTSGSWTSVSDSNWKIENVDETAKLISTAASIVDSVKPKEFNYKTSAGLPVHVNPMAIERRNMVVQTKAAALARSVPNAHAVSLLQKLMADDATTSYSGMLTEIATEQDMMREVGFLTEDIAPHIPGAVQKMTVGGTTYDALNYDQVNMIHLAASHYLMSTIEIQTSTLYGQEEEISRIMRNFGWLKALSDA